MAKSFPAGGTWVDALPITRTGDLVAFDSAAGGTGWQELNQAHNWLMGGRTKHHVQGAWEQGPVPASTYAQNVTVTGTGVGNFTVVLEYRITPRRHMPRLYIRANGISAAGTGIVNVVTPTTGAGGVNIGTLAVAPFAGANEIANTVTVTDTQPPTTQLVQVRLSGAAAEVVDLMQLLIMDVDALVGVNPYVLADLP